MKRISACNTLSFHSRGPYRITMPSTDSSIYGKNNENKASIVASKLYTTTVLEGRFFENRQNSEATAPQKHLHLQMRCLLLLNRGTHRKIFPLPIRPIPCQIHTPAYDKVEKEKKTKSSLWSLPWQGPWWLWVQSWGRYGYSQYAWPAGERTPPPARPWLPAVPCIYIKL